MVMFSPEAGELFYLHVLLHTVPNPTSFEYLKTVDDVTYDTFQQACHHRGLLNDDKEWEKMLLEAVKVLGPKPAIGIFTYILAYSEPGDPSELWEKFEEDFCFDWIDPNAEDSVSQAI